MQHEGSTFQKKRTRNRRFPRPAETDPYVQLENANVKIKMLEKMLEEEEKQKSEEEQDNDDRAEEEVEEEK